MESIATRAAENANLVRFEFDIAAPPSEEKLQALSATGRSRFRDEH